MVVKMMKWSPWSLSKKFQVKVKAIKLEGFDGFYESDEDKEEKAVMVEMRWKGPKVGLVSLRRTSKNRRSVSTKKILRNYSHIEWEDEFENVCNFSIFQKDNSFNPWDVSLNLLYGQSKEPKNKFAVTGTVLLNIAELASQREPLMERKLPIRLQVAGVASEASLLVSMSFVEIRSNSQELVPDSNMLEKDDGFFTRVRSLTSYGSKKLTRGNKDEEGREERFSNRFSGDSDESTTFDSEGSSHNDLGSTQKDSMECGSIIPPNECVIQAKEDESSVSYGNDSSDKEANLLTQLGSSPNSVTQFELTPKVGFWKKRRLSFRSDKKKDEPLTKMTNSDKCANHTNGHDPATSKEDAIESLAPTKSSFGEGELLVSSWEEKELISRDGQVKLKANVFFASIDQRSEKAAGESACTALVAVIADWLQLNPDEMPTRSMFDSLIIDGASEWRKLCENEAYMQRFPNKHFDLETVLEANPKSLSIVPDKSYVGFFYPERFESLKGAMSFDGIWDDICSNAQGGESEIYIVSWNDHFFVLKVEVDSYYIIDTLGERLFEGCNEAYILKFDSSTKLYKLPEKVVENAEEMTKSEKEQDDGGSENREESKTERLVYSGKECCREFIKRFLAAIPLKDLEMEEKKGINISSTNLHQRLQIEFHFIS